jgi:hypothetical protein
MDEKDSDSPVDPHVRRAIRIAQEARMGRPQEQAEPREMNAAIYRELCRLDCGCQRTGLPSDELLPPCRASAAFRARRECVFS